MTTVTLTFDNGPVDGITERILDILDRHGILATFFVVGRQLDEPEHRARAEQAHRAGHWIGNHTLTHTVALGDRPEAAYAVAEIEGAQARLGALGRPEKLFRPYGNDGLVGPHLLSRAAVAHLLAGNYTTVLWTSVPGDWRDPDGWVETCLDQVAREPWSVVVLHDIPGACLARLDELLVRLKARGTAFTQSFPDAAILTRDGAAVALDPGFIADEPPARHGPMPRLPYASRAAAPTTAQPLFDRLEAERGVPVENIFLMLAREPDLCEAVLGLAMALRKRTVIERRFRELAVLTVGIATGADYEVDHHWNAALKAGVTPAQMGALASFESSPLFDAEERAVMRYAREVTATGTTTDATWAALSGFLDERRRMELVLTVAWYNAVARMILPLGITREAWFERQ